MELEIHLQACSRRFWEFGAISRTYQNPPCSKPWAIAQAFCSKTANSRPSRIHPKSTQTVAHGVRNPFASMQQAILGVWSDFQDLPKSTMFETMGYSPGFLLKTVNFRPLGIHPKSILIVAQGVKNLFRRVQEAFQRVWSAFQNLPKSAIFETMGYSPGLLMKIGQFLTLANSPEIDTNSPLRSQKSIQKGLGGFSESLEGFPELTKIRHVQNHELLPRLFAQKRPISNTREFTRNRHKRSRMELEIHLEGSRKLFREFGTISRTYQNPPCSDHGLLPRVFAQKRPLSYPREFTRNRHKQSRKELEIHFQACRRRFWEFGAISRTYQNPPCSKAWAIAQAFCSKSANFRPLRIHPKSIQTEP